MSDGKILRARLVCSTAIRQRKETETEERQNTSGNPPRRCGLKMDVSEKTPWNRASAAVQ